MTDEGPEKYIGTARTIISFSSTARYTQHISSSTEHFPDCEQDPQPQQCSIFKPYGLMNVNFVSGAASDIDDPTMSQSFDVIPFFLALPVINRTFMHPHRDTRI